MIQRFASLVIHAGRRRTGPHVQPRVWRRLFHVFAGSSIPVAGLLAPDLEFLVGLTVVAAGAVVLDLFRFTLGPLNRVYMRWMDPLLKSDEEARLTGATHMLIAATVVFWLFGKEVGVPVMFFLSLGDPMAAIVGRRAPGPRLLGKSPVGTAAFAATGAAIAGVLVATGAIEHHWGLWAGAVIAALVELPGIPPDDNLTIPLIAGAAMWGLGV